MTGSTAVGNASLTVNGQEIARTNAQGFYFGSNVPQGNVVSVCFSKQGYARRCRNISLRGGQSLDVSPTEMMRLGPTAVLDPTAGGVVADSSTSARLSVPANALCQASATGAPASGPVTCSITPIDISKPETRALAPEFAGIDHSGQDVRLQTGGVMDIACFDSAGGPIQLCAGKTADARIPIYSQCSNATLYPPTMGLWDHDEGQGRWIERSTVTKTCNGDSGDTGYYAGAVTHFTPWNADKGAPLSCLHGRVLDPQGLPVDGAEVDCEGIDNYWNSGNYTGPDGNVCVPIVSSSKFICRAAKGSFATEAKAGEAAVSSATCSNNPSACTDIGTFAVLNPLLKIVLTWGQLPPDLDSHTAGANALHVWFQNRGSLTGPPFINLDTDVTTSFGPEITTFLPNAAAGTYRFCVHNYSGEVAGPLAQSQATIDVFTTDEHRTYHVPTNANPHFYDLWRVFDVTITPGAAPTFRDINDFVQAGGLDVHDVCLQ